MLYKSPKVVVNSPYEDTDFFDIVYSCKEILLHHICLNYLLEPQ